ncbi:MAG: hypothetical protein QW760_03845 [Thermofilaceae archaeon]
MSAWRSVYEALRDLVKSTAGIRESESVRQITASVKAGEGLPDPYLLKVFKFLAERVPLIRGEKPWDTPDFALFSEALMQSKEFTDLLWGGLSASRRREGALVDMHCGPAVSLEYAAKLWSRLIAVDPSDINLAIAEERLRGIGNSNYLLVKGDYVSFLRHLSEPIGSIIIASPSNWLYEPMPLISRASAALSPGGQFIMIAPLEWEGANPITPFLVALGSTAGTWSAELVRSYIEGERFGSVRFRRGPLLTLISAVKP